MSLHDQFSACLVYKLSFSQLHPSINAASNMNNTLLSLIDDLKKAIAASPISLIFDSHDCYEDVSNFEMEELLKGLRAKFNFLMEERYNDTDGK